MSRPYRCILMDPPWNERGGGKSKRGADRHYPTLKKHDIIRVIYQSGMWNPHPDGCHLWMWGTNNFLADALFVIEALGFRAITKVTWAKVTEDGRTQKGLGQYTYGSTEDLHFAVRGRLPIAKDCRPSTWQPIVAPRDEHSRKPEEAFKLVERVSPAPRLEMFARRKRPRWRVWGNEV